MTGQLIAAQLYTIRDRIHDADGLADSLRRLRQIGYGAVEVASLDPNLHDRFADELRAAGLVACAAHVALDELMSDVNGVASRCEAWGCEYVVVPSAPSEYQSADGYRRLAGVARHLAEALRRHDIGLAYHNHAFELEAIDGTNGLDLLYGLTASTELNAELDTYWLEVAGASAPAWIRRLAGRVPLVHLKDMAVVDGKTVQTEVGEGTLDWNGILEACRDVGTKWLIVEQDECTGDAVESLAISYRNLINLVNDHPEI